MLDITYELEENGIKIMCFSPSGIIKIPLFLNSKEKLKDLSTRDFEKLNLLDSFWQKSLVAEGKDNDCCFMFYDSLYEIPEMDRKILGLPVERDITAKVRSKGILYRSNFNVTAQLYLNHEPLGKLFRRHKNIVYFGKEHILLPKEIYELLSEIEKYSTTDNPVEQAKFVAKIKYKAKLAGAELDKILQAEEVYLPDKLDVEIKKHSDEHLELFPKFGEEIDEIVKDVQGPLASYNTLRGEGINRRRIFLEDNVKQSYNKIIEKKDIKGADVPKFLTNPYSVLPEEIDISKFGQRVKELGLRVYRANPYVSVTPDKNSSGWFDFDSGGIVEPIMYGNDFDKDEQELEKAADVKKINLEELKMLAEKAKEQGEDHIYYDGQWINIDVDKTENFITAWERELGAKKKIYLSNLSYVLKIFENIDSLEYNETAFKIKNQLTRRFDVSNFEAPANLTNCNLFKHQKEGYLWMQNLRQNLLGGLLADDMGLGKTLQVIAFMCFLKDNDALSPSLVIAPSTLLDVWEREIGNFSKITSVYQHRGPNRYKNIEMIKNYDVVLTTYETLVKDQLILGQIDWQVVACDEAQKIKNSTTLSTIAVKALKAKTKLAVTGTPVENNLGELWCIVDFVQPGLLNSYNEFRNRFQKPIENNIEKGNRSKQARDELLNTIKPVYIRREKEDILDLPKKHEHSLAVDLSSVQEKIYSGLIQEYKAGRKEQKGMALAVIQKLIQVCAHPRLVSGNELVSTKQLIDESGKLKLTLNILDEIQQRGEKAVIFTHYKKMQAILKKVLLDRYGINCSVINGDVKQNRIQIIDHFQNTPGFSVIILSTRAAGLGITITAANNVIHYTRSWNPAVENQATDRVYRIGQKRDVNIYYPISVSSRGSTVDERLDEILQQKRILARDIVIPSKYIKVGKQDIEYLLQDTYSFEK